MKPNVDDIHCMYVNQWIMCVHLGYTCAFASFDYTMSRFVDSPREEKTAFPAIEEDGKEGQRAGEERREDDDGKGSVGQTRHIHAKNTGNNRVNSQAEGPGREQQLKLDELVSLEIQLNIDEILRVVHMLIEHR